MRRFGVDDRAGRERGGNQRRDHRPQRPAAPRRECSGAALAPLLLAICLLAGCGSAAPRPAATVCPPLIDRAIAVRGGEIRSLRRGAEMQVYFGFPGTWRFEYAFRVPYYYRWTVFTSEQPNHYLWDGETMRAAVGTAVVGVDPSGAAPLRSHARWHAVTYLDSLCSGDMPAQFQSLPGDDSGEEVLLVRLLDDDSEYLLTFDRQARLLRASGPIEIPPFGATRLTQHYFDFRPAAGLRIAHATRYEVDGIILSEEQTTTFAVNDPALTPDFFRRGE